MCRAKCFVFFLDSEGSGMDTSLFCELCNVGFPSEYQKKQHFSGKKHARSLSVSRGTITTLSCKLCDVVFPSAYQQNQHMNGKKHLRKIAYCNRSEEEDDDYIKDEHYVKKEET